jgi:hypothetical protein
MAAQNLVYEDGETRVGAAPGDGNGGSAYVVDVAMADSQVGTDFKSIGVVHLDVGSILAASSMAWIGVDDNTNDAELEIRSAEDDTLLATLTKTGLVGAAAPGADIEVATAGEYSLRLRADTAGVTAFCFGVHLVYAQGAPSAALDTSDSPSGLWLFNGDLTAETGSSLSVATGTELYTPGVVPGDLGIRLRDVRLSQAHVAALNITAALTITFLIRLRGVSGTTGVILSFGADSETEANNVNYEVSVHPGGRLRFFQENSTGNDNTWDTGFALTQGTPTVVTLTRAANGVDMELFLDGISRDTNTMSNASTGGTTSFLNVGGFPGATRFARCTLSNLFIKNAVLTDAEILAQARSLLPPDMRT